MVQMSVEKTTVNENGAELSSKPKPYPVFLLLLMIVTSVPLTVNVGAFGVSKLQLADVFVPLFFGFAILDVALVTKNIALFVPRRGKMHFVFILIFMYVVLVSFARRPLLPGGEQDGFKFYLGFLNCLLTYMSAVYYINRNNIPSTQSMKILLQIVTIVTIIGIFQLATGLSIPGLDMMAWNVNETVGTSEFAGSLRIPFLENFGQTGFFLALTGVVLRKEFRWVFLFYFITCIFFGGGRAALVSSLGAVILWFFLNRRFALSGILVFAAFLSLMSIQVIYELAPTPQLKRLARLGTLEESSNARYLIFQNLVKEFVDNPIIGTGYGKEYDIEAIEVRGKFREPVFINKQLSMGSHGAHLQVLKNLGLLGYIPFLLIWVYPILKLLPVAMSRKGDYAEDIVNSAQFCIVLIGAMLVRMMVEGNGSEINRYILAAIVSCVISEVLLTTSRDRSGERSIIKERNDRLVDSNSAMVSIKNKDGFYTR